MFFEFDPTLFTIFFQLTLAALLGLLLGAERSIAGKSAGMRTFALVSLGACLFTVISILITTEYFGKVNFDPMRVPAAIITGIGFIGAGLIMFRQNLMRGLTTGAGMWIAAGVGMGVGFGLYAIAAYTTALTLFIFTAVWFIEAKLKVHFGRHNVEPIRDKEETWE
ncbi:magnesium transporter MgtC [bacterium]|nr:magnesium transporter MgtC [bacterium]|tara:strand:+ start:840 stop:1337 length:498 start_codon:yes stop_codon:yes gene_type:complete